MKWDDFVTKFAEYQEDFPVGVGMKVAWNIKSRIIGFKPSWEVRPLRLTEIIKECLKEWERINVLHNN